MRERCAIPRSESGRLVRLFLSGLCGLLWASPRSGAAPSFWPGDEIAAEDQVAIDETAPAAGSSGFDRWHRMVTASRRRQPPWVNPLITITPELVQQVRYDVYDQTKSSGNKSWDFGNGKGIDLLVAPTVQITVGLPQYLYSPVGGGVSGLRGENFAIKERILSSPENEGNYVLSVYLGALAPTGTLPAREPSDHWVWTPMLLFGKGWGPFDMMINVGTQYADGDNRNLESALIWNLALQYRVGLLCPSVEISSGPTVTRFLDVGTSGLFVTPQLLLGPFSAGKDLSFAGGIGYQIALNQVSVLEQYANALILSFRMLF